MKNKLTLLLGGALFFGLSILLAIISLRTSDKDTSQDTRSRALESTSTLRLSPLSTTIAPGQSQTFDLIFSYTNNGDALSVLSYDIRLDPSPTGMDPVEISDFALSQEIAEDSNWIKDIFADSSTEKSATLTFKGTNGYPLTGDLTIATLTVTTPEGVEMLDGISLRHVTSNTRVISKGNADILNGSYDNPAATLIVANPTPEPTAEPTPEPTAEPTAEPTPEPTAEPTPEPTAEPTPEPTAEPTPEPMATSARFRFRLEGWTRPTPLADIQAIEVKVRQQGAAPEISTSLSGSATFTEYECATPIPPNECNSSNGTYVGIYSANIPLPQNQPLQVGTYSLLIESDLHLDRRFDNVPMTLDASLGSFDLTEVDPDGYQLYESILIGDVTNDNRITSDDISLLMSYYTDISVEASTSNGNLSADLNKDGYITIEDVALALLNYNDFTLSGDE